MDDRFVLRIRPDQRELPVVSHLVRLQNTRDYASVRAFSCGEWSVPSFTSVAIKIRDVLFKSTPA